MPDKHSCFKKGRGNPPFFVICECSIYLFRSNWRNHVTTYKLLALGNCVNSRLGLPCRTTDLGDKRQEITEEIAEKTRIRRTSRTEKTSLHYCCRSLPRIFFAF